MVYGEIKLLRVKQPMGHHHYPLTQVSDWQNDVISTHAKGQVHTGVVYERFRNRFCLFYPNVNQSKIL